MQVEPIYPIMPSALTELIGINEKVDQNDYSGSVAVTVGDGATPASGEILSFCFYSTEDGTGAVQTPDAELIIFDTDPAVASGDTALAATEWPTVVANVSVSSSDWVADANGGVNYVYDQPVPFHGVTTLYFTLKITSATAINSLAADDEQIEFRFWYRRDS